MIDAEEERFMRWDPTQYARYAGERGRPFLDLVARIDCAAPRRVVDLGCGPGSLTELLTDRWPDARIEGLDSSVDMIDTAQEIGGHVTYRVQDVATWMPSADVDVVIANALLQWVPTHRDLLRQWADQLPSGAWLVFQVPGNFDAASHVLMRELAASPAWSDRLDGVLRHGDAVADPAEYARLLLDADLEPDAWETTYVHRLTGDDPVLEWVRGTGLRPILNVLGDDAPRFEREYAAALREAYPATAYGTFFPFRRIFAVAQKP
jgi:trans-aconitate 2-methyltransferase